MIISAYTILVVLVQCQGIQSISGQQREFMEKLRPSIEILCPGVDICGNTTEPVRNDIFDDVYTSCCKGCSCAGDCKRGTCCFGETNQTGLETSKGKCEPPVAFDDSLLFKTQRYYLIETEPVGGCVDENSTCHTQRRYPWGDILPVISKETNLIYKTPLCAQCHGLSRGDFNQWEMDIVCDKEPDDTANFFELFEMLIRDYKIPDNCMMVFANKGEQYAGNEKCYDYLVQDCKGDFEVPDELNMTKAEIVDACLNGPRIPTTIGKSLVSFYNPYCYICYKGLPSHLLCEADDRLIKGAVFGAFTALISADQLDLLIEIANKEIGTPLACKLSVGKMHREQDCREILCPLGQFRDRTGQCGYITDRWLSVDYVVMLDLHIDQNLPSTAIVYEAILEEMVKSLDTPPTWKVSAFFHVYPCDISDYQYNEFAVNFIVENTETLSSLLRFLGNILKLEHFVKFDDLEIYFRLSMNKFYQFKSTTVGNSELTPVIPSFETLNISKICYNILKYRDILILSEFIISKMFFCDQIKLQPSEYRLFQEDFHRVMEYSGRVLYLGEFLVESDYNGDTLVKVCLSDTDYHRVQETVKTSGADKRREMSMFFITSGLIFSTTLF